MTPDPATDGGGTGTSGDGPPLDAETTGTNATGPNATGSAGEFGAESGVSTGPGVWTNQVRAFAERCLRELSTSWVVLAGLVGTAAAMQLFFGVLWEGMPGETIASAAIGTGMFGAIYVSLYAFGYLLAGDLEDRRYEAYRSMPVSASADLSGRMLAGAALAAVAFGLTLGAGTITGGTFGLRGLASIPIVVLALGLSCAFWMLVALPIVVFAENERVAEYGVPTVAVLGYMATGFNGAQVELAPIDGELLNYLPNTLPTRLLIYHLVPSADWAEAGLAPPAAPAGPEYVLLLVGYAVAALVAGSLIANRVLYRRGWSP